MTGEAAVTLGATGQGMVAGDLVNTASRVQSVAEPGTVFVGEATRRASEQTVAYEHAGSYALKGKEGETPLWRALRVVSGRQGSLKSQGLEAPFVGRDRELRQIKELFHVSAEERRAQLVSVTGIAGIGKSRLAWEFYKYFDGIEQTVYWHRGRCLAYGEGVAYWALADMVRMRCGIAEDDEPAVALEKLRATLSEHLLDADDRRFVEPRLAQLLGIGEHEAREQGDLFAAWRLFFERLADTYPTVLAFEDMQWADGALLDFVEHLLEWSRDQPIFVITLARPDLAERRPTWGAAQRNFTSIYLEPLPEPAMRELLAGLVPGLPAGLRDQVLSRAEGVPLYAVETVRMLLDRGLLAEEGSSYRVVGEVESLAIPETLQALAAARLDGLAPEERRIVQDAAVLGKTFSPAALSALSGIAADDLRPLLGGLVRKELLGVQLDPRSPEHGQYGFLQDLIRQVAYDTLARRDRREKHLAAATLLASTLAEEEVAEVVASHLLEAYRLEPEAQDAEVLRERARRALFSAGERVAAVGAATEALNLFVQAAELGGSPDERGDALSRAGETASMTGSEEAARLLDRAHEAYTDAGRMRAAARVAGYRARLDSNAGKLDDAIRRMEAAYRLVEDEEPDADVALLMVRLAGAYAFTGDLERAQRLLERTLDTAEALGLPQIMSSAWNARALTVVGRRPNEARGLYRLAIDTALEHDLPGYAITPIGNLSDVCFRLDRYDESLEHLEQALVLARKVGSRMMERFMRAEQTYALMMAGRWDEAVAVHAELPVEADLGNLASVLLGIGEIRLRRGEGADVAGLLVQFDEIGRSSELQNRNMYDAAVAGLRLAEGRPAEALASAQAALATADSIGLGAQGVKIGYLHGLEAALRLGEVDEAERLLAVVENAPPGLRPPYLAALALRYRARLAGDAPAADRHYAAAVTRFRALKLPFDEAVASLEYGDWLVRIGRPDEGEPLLAAARETFERLRATPWLERASAGAAVAI
jgi:tetratricopeptide (TPR) repeat protein